MRLHGYALYNGSVTNLRHIVLAGLAAVGLACSAEPSIRISRMESLDGRAGYRREMLVEAEGAKYPIRRVVETCMPDPVTDETRMVKRSRMVGDHIIVKLLPDVARKELERLNARLGTVIRREMHTPRMFLVASDTPGLDTVPHLVEAYGAETSTVEYAEPDFLVELCDTNPDDPYFPGNQWGHVKVACPAAWAFATGTGGVVVAVIDTGIDYNHGDLAGNIWMNPGETGIDTNGIGMATNGVDDDANGFIDDVYGWNFNADSSYVMDGHSHGTRCSGSIGAVGNNATGVVGVCWNVKLMAIKLWSDTGELTSMSDAVDSFHYVLMMRANGVNVRVTSNSWSEDEYAQSFEDAVRAHRDAGILCVSSVGNSSENIDNIPVYPPCFDLDNVIAVAGTTETDGMYANSSYGVTNADLGAPAQNIWTTGLNNTIVKSPNGTSRSAPFVAGVAALTWELMPSLSYREVRRAIFDGVDQVTSMQGKVATGGRLNAHKALLEIGSVISHVPLINTTNMTGAYDVEADILPLPLLPADLQWTCWNTNGSTNVFTTNLMARVTNNTYHSSIPSQSLGTMVHYYLRSETTNGLVATDPTNAPDVLHTFEVVEPMSMSVTGTPVQVGNVVPHYGDYRFPSGIVISVSSQAYSAPENGQRYAVDGWNGKGSVPVSGSSNSFVFALQQPSTCEWTWAVQYGLSQTSSIAGIIDTTTWWHASSAAQTVPASSQAFFGETNYGFAGWYVDGARQPDATSPIVNPATSILMHTQRFAHAWYLPADDDDDGDELLDYWEFAYFGDLSPAWTNDGDGDGMVNGHEMVAGTDPADYSDVLAIVMTELTNAGTNIVIQWTSVSNRTYSINARVDLTTGTWNVVTSGIPATEPLNMVAPPAHGAGSMYYRVGVGE